MMENSLIGADIMPTAVNLTASILSASHPREFFEGTRVILLPYGQTDSNGVSRVSIGSLDLIMEDTAVDLFGAGTEINGTSEERITLISNTKYAT